MAIASAVQPPTTPPTIATTGAACLEGLFEVAIEFGVWVTDDGAEDDEVGATIKNGCEILLAPVESLIETR